MTNDSQKSGENKGYIVLGQQFSAAKSKEQERLKNKSDIPSAMPGKHYERQKGQWGLLTIKPCELDTELRGFCISFAEKSKSEQDNLRAAISLDEFYTLIEFAKRSSVFALRDKDSDILNSALISIAMIEAERTDYRDILDTLALLHHSVKRIGLDPSSTFLNFAKIAEPGTSELISRFIERDFTSYNLPYSCGYSEVNTEYGIGFIRWHPIEEYKYKPELDLLSLAMKIALIFEEDSYFIDRIELATGIPSVWLEGPESENLQQTLEKITAGATVSCNLEGDKYRDQLFVLFMVELDSKESAKALLEMSQKKKPKDYSMIGFSGGKLFALLIARSVVVGVESFETEESLRRFIKPIDQIIQEMLS